jgi:glucose/arabinose dehydrogenase
VAFTTAAALPGSASPHDLATYTVRVDIRDSSCAVSRRSAPAGSTVRFAVRNRGAASHAFLVKGRRTRALRPGQRQTITVAFTRKGVYPFVCSVPGNARRAIRGTFTVTSPPARPTPPPVDTSELVTLTRIGAFARPVLVTAPPEDARRIFVVEQEGLVRVVRDGETLPTPFLDIRDKVKVASEPGLLSIVFAPDYESSGLFYAFYNSTAGNGDIRISEFRRHMTDPDLADPYSERVLLTITKPWENHNGGMLQFGPDGFLYASVGDGDGGTLNAPGFWAQRRDDLLGNILRIDPRSGDPYGIPADNPFVALAGVRPEIWAYGLRNPWRFWIDHETGALFVGDAGNQRREEIDLVPRGMSGVNLGWPCFEGSLPFDTTASCDGAVPPLLEYPREAGACVVIGGVVARDPRLSAISGRYLYGDFCSGKVTAVAVESGQVTATGDLGIDVPQLTSFGVDASARIYVLSLRGDVFRLDPKPAG